MIARRVGFPMTQQFPIQHILDQMNIDIDVTKSLIIPVVGLLIRRDEQGLIRAFDWEYRILPCMLGCL